MARMRLVIWNCNMAFDKKYNHLLSLEPDIAIIPESANQETLKRKASEFRPASQVWVGDNPNKGLSVFTFGDYTGMLSPLYNAAFPFIAPIAISGPTTFHLLGVWACHAKSNSYDQKLGPLSRSLKTYRNFILSSKTVVAGDFNDNVRWDKVKAPNKHALNVAVLEELGLRSAYHSDRSEAQGAEKEPTIFWRNRTENGPQYHIDYCFVPESWSSQMSVCLGQFADWVAPGLSDHVPLVVDITP